MKYGRYTIRNNKGVMQYPYSVLIKDKTIDNCSTILGAMKIILRDSKKYKEVSEVERVLLQKIKFIGDGEFTVLGTPQEFVDECNGGKL